MSNFNLTYQKDGENEQLYYKDAYNNDLYIRSCEDFAPAIIQEKSGNPIDITDGADCPIRKLKVIFEPIQSGTGVPSPDNIRPITGRDSVTVWRGAVYDPSADPALTIQLGQTVYGGTLDVIAGVLTVDRATVTLDGTEANIMRYTWGHTYYFTDLKSGGADNLYAISNQYKPGAEYWGVAGTGEILTNQNSVIIMDDRFNTVEAWNTHVAELYANDTPIEICYRLAEPQIIQLTPEQLSTLKGENTFSTDGTSIELEYVVDTKTYIDNLFNSGTKTVVKPNDEIKIIDENKGVE